MTEYLPRVASSELKGESADKLRDGLVADYLCATNSKDEEMALVALRKDEFRLVMAGMTPEQRALWNTLDKVDWKAVQREGLTSVLPLLFGAYLGLTLKPEEATTIATTLGAAGTSLEFLSMAAAVPEAVARHQRASGLAKAIAAVRVGTFYAGKVGLFTALGTGAAALAHRNLLETQTTAQQAVAGETGGYQTGPSQDVRELQRHAAAAAPGGEPVLRSPDAVIGGGQPPVEQVGPQHPGVGRLPTGETAMIPPEERLGLPGDAEVLAQQAAAQAEAARIAALQQGPTVAELAANMPKQTISEAIYQMIGDVPHRGEVTNVLFRAIGDKVNNLNEGAIKAAAEALRPIFDNIDQVVAGSGVPYTEGGRAAVEAMRGFNSPEAQVIRAGNLGDLEAAGNLFNNVIGPVIK